MKRTLTRALAFASLTLAASAASTASAGSSIGIFTPIIGVQYQQDISAQSAIRFGVGLPIGGFGSTGSSLLLSGDAAYLYRFAETGNTYAPYVGGGLGLLTMTGTGGSLIVSANALVGLEYNFTDRLFSTVEVGFGPTFAPGQDGVVFWPSFRSSLNFRL